jgi:hypothetical protein
MFIIVLRFDRQKNLKIKNWLKCSIIKLFEVIMNVRLKMIFINNNIKQVDFAKKIGIQNSMLSMIIREQTRKTTIDKYKSVIIKGFQEHGIDVTENDIWHENDEISELEETFSS